MRALNHQCPLFALCALALVVAGCASSANTPTADSQSPAASESPTVWPAATQHVDDQWVVAVPATTASTAKPVVWFGDASDDHLLVAYDWSAHIAGTMRVNATEPFGVKESPDGTRLLLTHATPASGGAVVGRSSGYGTWAHDAAHLCVFHAATGNVD